MYDLINKHSAVIVEQIGVGHVQAYDQLVNGLPNMNANLEQYQGQYRRFWAMNPAMLWLDFYPVYFQLPLQ